MKVGEGSFVLVRQAFLILFFSFSQRNGIDKLDGKKSSRKNSEQNFSSVAVNGDDRLLTFIYYASPLRALMLQRTLLCPGTISPNGAYRRRARCRLKSAHSAFDSGGAA